MDIWSILNEYEDEFNKGQRGGTCSDPPSQDTGAGAGNIQGDQSCENGASQSQTCNEAHASEQHKNPEDQEEHCEPRGFSNDETQDNSASKQPQGVHKYGHEVKGCGPDKTEERPPPYMVEVDRNGTTSDASQGHNIPISHTSSRDLSQKPNGMAPPSYSSTQRHLEPDAGSAQKEVDRSGSQDREANAAVCSGSQMSDSHAPDISSSSKNGEDGHRHNQAHLLSKKEDIDGARALLGLGTLNLRSNKRNSAAETTATVLSKSQLSTGGKEADTDGIHSRPGLDTDDQASLKRIFESWKLISYDSTCIVFVAPDNDGFIVAKVSIFSDTSIASEFEVHLRVFEAFQPMFPNIRVPRPFYYEERPGKSCSFPGLYRNLIETEKTSSLQPRFLFMERIPRMNATRSKALNARLKDFAFLIDDSHCTWHQELQIHPCLGVSFHKRYAQLRDLKLNWRFLESFGALVERIASNMGTALATLHYGAKVDGRGIKFILSDMPPVRENCSGDSGLPNANSIPLDSAYFFTHEVSDLWLINFRRCESITMDSEGIMKAYSAFKDGSRIYFPRPATLMRPPTERRMWIAFVGSYYHTGTKMLSREEQQLNLPNSFLKMIADASATQPIFTDWSKPKAEIDKKWMALG